MSAPEHFDVAVVGGGPAGAAAARAAVRHGARVVLLERDARPRARVCGEYLCPGGVRRLRELGLGEALDAAVTAPLHGMRLFAPSGREVRTRFPDGQPGLSVLRHDLDPRLVAHSGAEVRRGVRVGSVTLHADRGVLGLDDGREISADVVIGADGRNSIVARRCGLHASPGRRARATIHGLYRGVAGCERRGEMHLAGDGSYLGLNPRPDGCVNVTYVCDLAALEPGDTGAALTAILRALRSLAGRFDRAELVSPARVLAPLEVRARAVWRPRVLLAGDAAGFLDPLTGEGMYGAIVGGALAGEFAARFRATPLALRGYARARRRALGAKGMLNLGFQWLLDRPRVLESLGRRLAASPRTGDALLAVIGNTARPASLLRPRTLGALAVPVLWSRSGSSTS